ncbi:hypothetical protein J4Q44_G00134550 [Coregonus suidteri]|uniref:Uncharacterized protein n=1 Tax=Coregonus suidteri TaxID=861788 RepID=A0AAN8MBZ5_9TELE
MSPSEVVKLDWDGDEGFGGPHNEEAGVPSSDVELTLYLVPVRMVFTEASAKSLGVTLDNTLSFSANIKAVTRSYGGALWSVATNSGAWRLYWPEAQGALQPGQQDAVRETTGTPPALLRP